jgi:predicted aconitase
MKLTRYEQEMLDGKFGEAVQKAMELLVAIGECYDADRMVPVASAHLVAAQPVTAGRGGREFMRGMAEKGGKFVIPVTTNPACLEPWTWREMGFSEDLHQAHLALWEVLAQMGTFISQTCTPYLIGHAPRMGQHIAWGESSAVVYTNSVLGSRTNREGGPNAISAALTGRTPAYGYHLDENRHGKIKVIVKDELKGDTDCALLGYFTGMIAEDRVPIITGIPVHITQHELKCLGAALAVSGSVALYHVVGVTPEAHTEEMASGGKKITASDTFEFGSAELRKTQELCSQTGPEEIDLVVLGCPHASIDQVRNYAEVLSGRKVKSEAEIWILLSHVIKRYAEDLGYADILESAGAKLVSNACPSGMPTDFFRNQGYLKVATDSPKMAYYTSTRQGASCYCGNFDKFIDTVTTKR